MKQITIVAVMTPMLAERIGPAESVSRVLTATVPDKVAVYVSDGGLTVAEQHRASGFAANLEQ